MKYIIIAVLFVATLPVQAEEFEVGQVWSYESRTNENQSSLTIVKLEVVQGHSIVHIGVSGLKLKARGVTVVGTEIAHMPFAETALRESVVQLLRKNASLPDYESGYRMWKKAVTKGEGGWFTVSVAEAVEFVEQSLQR